MQSVTERTAFATMRCSTLPLVNDPITVPRISSLAYDIWGAVNTASRMESRSVSRRIQGFGSDPEAAGRAVNSRAGRTAAAIGRSKKSEMAEAVSTAVIPVV